MVVAMMLLSTNYDYAGPFYPYPNASEIPDRESFGVYSAYLTNGWEVYRTDDGGNAVYMRRSWLRGIGQAGKTEAEAEKRVQIVQATATAVARPTATAAAQATAKAQETATIVAQPTATAVARATATAVAQETAKSEAQAAATVYTAMVQATSVASATAVALHRRIELVPDSTNVVCKDAKVCQATVLVKNTGTVDAVASLRFDLFTDQQLFLAFCFAHPPGLSPGQTTRADCTVVRQGEPTGNVAYTATSRALGDYLDSGGIVHGRVSFLT